MSVISTCLNDNVQTPLGRIVVNILYICRKGVIQFEFRRDLWRQKTRVPGLTRGIICVIVRLAVLIQYWSVTDRLTHDDGIYRASMASRGKNSAQMPT